MTVPEAGWAGLKNGDLLGQAQGGFDVFITVDRNLPSQQALSRFGIAVIVLRARTNRLAELLAVVPELLEVLPVAKSGEATWVGN